jgi:hypothetical protein
MFGPTPTLFAASSVTIAAEPPYPPPPPHTHATLNLPGVEDKCQIKTKMVKKSLKLLYGNE